MSADIDCASDIQWLRFAPGRAYYAPPARFHASSVIYNFQRRIRWNLDNLPPAGTRVVRASFPASSAELIADVQRTKQRVSSFVEQRRRREIFLRKADALKVVSVNAGIVKVYYSQRGN